MIVPVFDHIELAEEEEGILGEFGIGGFQGGCVVQEFLISEAREVGPFQEESDAEVHAADSHGVFDVRIGGFCEVPECPFNQESLTQLNDGHFQCDEQGEKDDGQRKSQFPVIHQIGADEGNGIADGVVDFFQQFALNR